jgi:hypothetical protein
MSGILSTEKGKELLALCRAGKLYEVEAWVASKRSIQVPAEIRKTPLHIAVDLGLQRGGDLLLMGPSVFQDQKFSLWPAFEARGHYPIPTADPIDVVRFLISTVHRVSTLLIA